VGRVGGAVVRVKPMVMWDAFVLLLLVADSDGLHH
jgi:hypothetical protein